MNNKSQFDIKIRIISRKDTNSRHKILTNLSTFEFIVIITYVACFIILSIIIKITSHVFLVYKFLAENISVIKFNITMWNEITLFDNIEDNFLYGLWWYTHTL